MERKKEGVRKAMVSVPSRATQCMDKRSQEVLNATVELGTKGCLKT